MDLTFLPQDIENIINEYVNQMNHYENTKKILPILKEIYYDIEKNIIPNKNITMTTTKIAITDTSKLMTYIGRDGYFHNRFQSYTEDFSKKPHLLKKKFKNLNLTTNHNYINSTIVMEINRHQKILCRYSKRKKYRNTNINIRKLFKNNITNNLTNTVVKKLKNDFKKNYKKEFLSIQPTSYDISHTNVIL